VVIVTRDVAIPSLTSVTVVQVTTSIRGAPSELPVGAAEGLRHDSVASCDNIYTIRKSQLSKWIGALGPDKLDELAKTIRIALDL
jgi:mRNA interferase MazF